MRIHWKVAAAVLAIAVGAGAFLLSSKLVDPLRAMARKDWKDAAIAEIQRHSADTNWLGKQIRTVDAKATEDQSGEGTWFSDGLMLMKNGEWLAYASKCSKEDSRIRDIFIARGSDGQWRYSTYHFCVRMITLQIEEQPESLSAFSKSFFARPFDGRSDECLNKTWPPQRQSRPE